MLTDLSIRNFAIIDNLHISFGGGLNILTGETGAGKSIIVDAVNLILGERAAAGMIREGADEASVEALFAVPAESEVNGILAEAGIPCEGELVVRRVISSGRNRIFLNGGMATGNLLSRIAPQLVNIYGQHESQTLLRAGNHLELLDGFAGLLQLRAAFASCHAEYRAARLKLAGLDAGEREAEQRLDLLSYQVKEIDSASLRDGEEEEIEQERGVLTHADRLYRGAIEAFQAMYDAEPSALSLLAEAKRRLADCSHIDPKLADVAERAAALQAELEDSALEVRAYADRIEPDPERLAALEDRLDLIRRMRRKYGASIAEIISFREKIGSELDDLRDRDRSRDEAEKGVRRAEGRLRDVGRELSSKRRDAAGVLKRALENELHHLAMPHAVFDVLFQDLAEAGPAGFEKAEFLFAPNPGEGLKPLSRIASGGELSRLMLALKQIHPDSDVPTLVFDEVDTGIGGSVAALVGKKLRNVARGQQVLCITHMPQVAASADSHYRVEKKIQGGRTATSVVLLGEQERVAEIARMLAGEKVTDKTMAHAAEMIENAATA